MVLRADVLAHLGRFDVKGQWLKGHAAGEAAQGVYGLDLNGGGYLEVDAMLTPSFGMLGRGEYRDAFVWLDNQRAYLTKSWRATLGLRWVLTPRAVVKAEYLTTANTVVSRRSPTTCSPPAWSWAFDAAAAHGPESKTPDRGDRDADDDSCIRPGCALRARADVCARRRPQPPSPRPTEAARLQGEIDRLKQELAEQRQLILQLMQAEQQRYDVVLKLLRAGGAPGADVSSALPAAAVGGGDRAQERPRATRARTRGAGGREAATVTGRVRTGGGQSLGEAYVYVDGLRSSARGHTVEIKQRDKQFAPRVVVVPLGTKLVFPNQDTVIHNVFSTAPGNSFDLGSVKGGRRRRRS